ncbi:MAG TPA: leucine--tRNA ligase [Candidatus Ornithomonoglobus intestinigallinarum]|uniref:Leucine--tRNA ligase n=1 Tax=Candidatus Ornithomonoglobus intestinigallinarum TaxID=2840894 RepID=A0A9D1H2N2_9FIRM|nr:leucine--tRNA ligase [Candidatus Ornithomonoglobus intestinigallinarum]
MEQYNFKSIEKKWQDRWESEGAFHALNDPGKPKYFALIEFPYPSGMGLHVGHPRGYTALDIIARKRRMEGYNVLYPIGWDAFGLPTENYAIKNNVHPKIITEKNIANFTRQLKMLGFSFDWSREVNTTDPKYYKWTQWIFLQLFKHGLAYKQEMPINWCTGCKVGLANEEVVNGVCERCGSPVEQRRKSQWMLKITEYAQRLIDDLDSVDYLEKIKTQQKNWIGRSEGAEVKFTLSSGDELVVYTTRPDTLFGATYVVMSPEHALVEKLKDQIENYGEVEEYKAAAARKSEFERTELAKEKTGVALKGVYAVNPVNGEKLPVWISDYVLVTYGTGAIMAVPAHDSRDWEFAKKFNLPIIEVVAGGKDVQAEAYTDVASGTMVNSGFLTGMSVKEAIPAMIAHLEEKGLGTRKVNFKLRDWVFSRQRYWGEPIPLVYCEKCGWVPIDESELPLELPDIEHFEPGENGESPLAKAYDWINTTCPHCGGPAKRETDTMPQWAGSSWYFLRYTDPHNDGALASKEALEYWSPVDWYNGGMEHTTLHLLYSRFWHKFLYDIGVVPTKEPYMKRTSHGMILGENGEKMSKSRGNVVNPDEVVNEFGADAFRTYEMFIGAFDQATPWSQQGLKGCYKFLERVWSLQNIMTGEDGYSRDLEKSVYKTIKKVGEDYERMKYNTAIAAMMSLVNEFTKKGSVTKGEYMTLITLLNPVAPHMTEELWEKYGNGGLLSLHPWPKYDEAKTVDDEVEIVVQINGKIKDKMMVPAGLDRDSLTSAATENEKIKALTEGKNIVKVIAVPGKLVNIVVK